jgi:hypothetical protein
MVLALAWVRTAPVLILVRGSLLEYVQRSVSVGSEDQMGLGIEPAASTPVPIGMWIITFLLSASITTDTSLPNTTNRCGSLATLPASG